MDASSIDLTGAFAADIPHETIPLGCETGEPMGIEPCSCEQALDLRDRLAMAARGTVAIHVVKESGYWTIERWRDGEMVEAHAGAPNVAEALTRIGDWLRE